MRAVLLLVALAPTLARADSAVTVQLSPDGTTLANQLGITPADLEAQIKQGVDAAYSTGDVDSFLRAFSDATSFSARGLGVDYASTPTGFLAGFAVNIAAAGNGDVRNGEAPTAGGLAANLGVMLGLNLSKWEHPKWTVFANGFYQTAKTDELEGKLLSLGGHLSYRLLEPTKSTGSGSAVRWLGLTLTSGFELTRWKLGARNDTLSTEMDIGGAGGSTTLSLDQTGRYDLETTAISVPFEASTGFRVALLLSVYGGVGIDVTTGTTKVDANLDGSLVTPDNQNIGTVQITSTGESAGSPAAGRVFLGAQLNLWKLKFFVQGNVAATPAASVAFGLRIVQ